jgi:acyl CoA:acetate/3-ketoacid CoA transferase beta subunit
MDDLYKVDAEPDIADWLVETQVLVKVAGPAYQIAEGSEDVYVVRAAIDRKHLVKIGGDDDLQG